MATLAWLFAESDDLNNGVDTGRRYDSNASVARASQPSAADGALLARLRADDTTALASLIDAEYPRLVRYATTIVHDEAAADIVQDVFVIVWERRHTIDVRGSLASYLFRAVRNAALNYVRDERAARNRAHRVLAGDTSLASNEHRPDTELEAAEQERLVSAAIDALAPRYREVIALRANGLGYDEISAVLGVPLKTAQTRGRRGIALLRERLAGRL